MDFFAHQDNARRLSRRLILLLVLAVVAIVITVNVVAMAVFGRQPGLPVAVTLVTLAIIVGGSLYRVYSLADGGSAVAEMMGARRILSATTDFDEKRLVNIVEEMAIAAGIAVPTCYLMDRESGINAFAAGFSPNEAVVCVTRGTLKHLNRDELQGVVGHEFSHILNGDMRLNVRMLGLLHGILLIGLIGGHIMNGTSNSRSSRDRDSGGIFFLGLGLFGIGYIGVFFANVIKAAVSRQREFLADASAVQFTRNPEGIGGALLKIGKIGGTVNSQGAEELSHMFLGAGTRRSLDGLLATHPPIAARVARLLGEARASMLERRIDAGGDAIAAPAGASGFAAGATPSAAAWGRSAGVTTTVQTVLDSVGNPNQRHVEFARELLDQLPVAVRTTIATEEGAKAALFAMLLGDDDVRAIQLDALAKASEHKPADLAIRFAEPLKALGVRSRLPIVELALPVLKVLPAEERRELLALVRILALADRRVSAFEFVIMAILERALDDDFERKQKVRYNSLAPVAAQVAVVVSMFVRAASGGSVLFERIMARLVLAGQRLTSPSAMRFEAIQAALVELKGLAPLAKPLLIKGCLEAIMEDGKIAVVEGELMRAVCALLDSPLPPILEHTDPLDSPTPVAT